MPGPLIPAPSLPLRGKTYLLLTAAGTSSRFGGAKKELVRIAGRAVLECALDAFIRAGNISAAVVTCPSGGIEAIRKSISPSLLELSLDKIPGGIAFIEGGPTRQASVERGLDFLVDLAKNSEDDPDDSVVLIHDAARPWVTTSIIMDSEVSAKIHGACIPLADFADTPKLVSDDGFIESHLQRDILKAAQTPQAFSLGTIAKAHNAASREGWVCTDDAALWARYVGKVAYTKGDRSNRKITYREDIAMPESRIGEGWDIHPLVEGRALMLGGVAVDHDRGEAGHSDGDVLWHAIIDALLGAAGLGDIGTHFPPSDLEWKDARSSSLAGKIADLVASKGWQIGNIDSTVILEKPKLAPWKERIILGIASTLGIAPEAVSVKAKTMEGFGEIGRGDAIEARAIVLLIRNKDITSL